MEHGAYLGDLSIRAGADGSRTVSGRFPYNSLATLSDGGKRGRPRKEKFKPHAFRHSVESPEQEISLLFGHSFDRPLASKLTGGLILTDTAEALTFEARIASEVANTSYGADALALIGAGLAVGLSPGFRIPPERTVPNAETLEEEDPSLGTALIRTINEAILFELSIVSRPAYPQSSVEARSAWVPHHFPRMWGYR